MILGDVITLTLVATGLAGLGGAAVYVMFYGLFQRLYGSKLRVSEPGRDDVVMCGMDYPSARNFIVPISRVFVDVMTRAFKGVRKIVESFGSALLEDWFFYAVLILSMIIGIGIAVSGGAP